MIHFIGMKLFYLIFIVCDIGRDEFPPFSFTVLFLSLFLRLKNRKFFLSQIKNSLSLIISLIFLVSTRTFVIHDFLMNKLGFPS